MHAATKVQQKDQSNLRVRVAMKLPRPHTASLPTFRGAMGYTYHFDNTELGQGKVHHITKDARRHGETSDKTNIPVGAFVV